MSFLPNMADPYINDESKGVQIDEVSRPLILEKILQTEMLRKWKREREGWRERESEMEGGGGGGGGRGERKRQKCVA